MPDRELGSRLRAFASWFFVVGWLVAVIAPLTAEHVKFEQRAITVVVYGAVVTAAASALWAVARWLRGPEE